MRNKTLFVIFPMLFCNAVLAIPATSPSICPDIGETKKNTDPQKQNWTAQTKEGKWKSYDTSFATQLTQFLGAQWSGANLGQLTCVYKSEQQFELQGQSITQQTIPVLLIYHSLTFKPTGGAWKRTGLGLYNCYSRQQKDCQFIINVEPPVGNVLQQAESFKELNVKTQPLLPPSD